MLLILEVTKRFSIGLLEILDLLSLFLGVISEFLSLLLLVKLLTALLNSLFLLLTLKRFKVHLVLQEGIVGVDLLLLFHVLGQKFLGRVPSNWLFMDHS